MRDLILRATQSSYSLSRLRLATSPSLQRRCRSIPPNSQQTQADSLQFVAGFELTSAAPEWGGYSGMVLSHVTATTLSPSPMSAIGCGWS